MQPLLRTDQVETRNKLERHYATLLDMYLNRFYSRNERTLLVPSQQRATYDPFVTMFMVRIIGSDEHPMVSGIETLDVHSPDHVQQDIMVCIRNQLMVLI